MHEKNILEERRLALEEEFVHRHEKQLLDEMRRELEREKTLSTLAEAWGYEVDERFLSEAFSCGYTQGTVCLLWLVPALMVAWSDGHISQKERDALFAASRALGLAPESEAARELLDWTLERPIQPFFEKSLELLAHAILLLSPTDHGQKLMWVLQTAERVAEISGGVLGFGDRVSREEKDTLTHIHNTLHARAKAAAV